jgi:hypothetical protein
MKIDYVFLTLRMSAVMETQSLSDRESVSHDISYPFGDSVIRPVAFESESRRLIWSRNRPLRKGDVFQSYDDWPAMTPSEEPRVILSVDVVHGSDRG